MNIPSPYFNNIEQNVAEYAGAMSDVQAKQIDAFFRKILAKIMPLSLLELFIESKQPFPLLNMNVSRLVDKSFSIEIVYKNKRIGLAVFTPDLKVIEVDCPF
jgi:hypothetical protein